jgi:hypothetical protein
MKSQCVRRTIKAAAVASALAALNSASAADIGFVAGLTGGALDKPFDLGWSARLISQGHTVTIFDQTTPAADPLLATMDLLIVSQDVGGSTFRNNVGVNQPMPMLAYEPALYTDFFGAGNASSGGISGGVTIVNAAHPLAAGLSGDVSIYTGTENTSRFAVSEVSPGTTVIAQMVATPDFGIFAVLEAGALGGANDATTYPALRMALPCHDSWDPALVTADGWKLLDGAVAYALPIPEPSTFALLGLGALLFLARRHSR